MAHIAWLGKKSPFCGNVTYGLTTTYALRQRGHGISFIHFDTPATGLSLPEFGSASRNRMANERARKASAALQSGGPATGGGGNVALVQTNPTVTLAEENPEVALPYLMKSQVYTIPSLGAQRALRESLERLRPDVVHASLTLSPLDFLLPDLCQQLDLPLVATFHPAFDASLRNLAGGTQQLTYQLYAPSLARYDRVIVFSELQAEVLIRLGVRRERLAVIPNGVDTATWRPASVSPSPELAALQQRFAGRRVFLYMGRVATEKNVEALLRAWRLVRPRGCVLVIVGDGPVRAALQGSSSDPDVVWWGFEPSLERRVALQQLAEVFLLPSLVEGLSLALLEAMASGTACVATDAGADGEVLAEGAGIVISTQGVTTQLRTLLPVLRDQPVLTQELGRRARVRAMERYTLAANIDSLEQLYGELCHHSQVA
ncbi:glycosyltransferase family 4 protein [Synechococcus sp. CCY9201]|uniref:glycosyltransferase family 4 protein n=1 Tax=unclassified Synechococcus TaxID=2626047 RepID=UPI001E46F225|nr:MULTISPECIES: glycosyltransferase family 4 protein [unclassified Synechococcus]MEA5473659.1 glycosyltransferase family 4 protein [Synechococcus sp. CCY9201]CAK6697499.1 D-inositol-3-phosphate glycosyltransferase [Synechococcus sp. CBW1107]